jgi:hypothetical protein
MHFSYKAAFVAFCKYEWADGTLLMKHFLTHAEYDKNKWCKDCIPPGKEKTK